MSIDDENKTRLSHNDNPFSTILHHLIRFMSSGNLPADSNNPIKPLQPNHSYTNTNDGDNTFKGIRNIYHNTYLPKEKNTHQHLITKTQQYIHHLPSKSVRP